MLRSLFFIFISSCMLFAPAAHADTVQEKTCGKYTIRIHGRGAAGTPTEGMGKLEIFQGGKQVFAQEDWNYAFGVRSKPENILLRDGCPDITGDKVDDLVITGYSGGAHCCSTTYVFGLGDDVKLFDTLETGHSEGSFEDLDQDGIPEFIANDWTFAYWQTSFAASPAPQIILRFKDGKYRLAADLMKKPKPSLEEKKKILEQVKTDIDDVQRVIEETPAFKAGTEVPVMMGWIKNGTIIPPSVWGYMLDLMYSLNELAAIQFLDEAVPGHEAEKREFMAEFKKQMQQSRYWPELSKALEISNWE